MNKLAVSSFFDFFENDSSLHDFLSRASLLFFLCSVSLRKIKGGKALFFFLKLPSVGHYHLATQMCESVNL